MNDSAKAPGLVNWTGYLSLAALLILPVSVLAARTGAWQPALLMYAVAMLGSAMLILLSVFQLLLPRYAGWRTNISLNTLFAFPGTLLFLSLLSGGDYPRIHDITTDTEDPPTFTRAHEMRGDDANTLAIKPESIALQIEAFPELQTLRSRLAPADAFDRAAATARKLEWNIYHEDRNAGIIEAVDITRFMAFKDDIVIRIRRSSDNGVTLVDLRSVSRVGEGDIGANAKRVQAFITAFEEK